MRIDQRALNTPQPVAVEAAPDGTPRAYVHRGQRRRVESINEQWRMDDEWWRAKPVSRMYWEVVDDLGGIATLFQDLTDHAWYLQRGISVSTLSGEEPWRLGA